MDTPTSTTQQMPSYQPPMMVIEPEVLAFGVYNPNLPLLQQPIIRLKVRNTGGSTLTGRVVPQVSWLIINPMLFKLKPGESCELSIQLSTGAPQQLNKEEHFFANAMLLVTNAGPRGLDASYTLDFAKRSFSPAQMNFTPKKPDVFTAKILPMAAVGLFFVLVLLGGRYLLFPPGEAAMALSDNNTMMTVEAQNMLDREAEAESTAEPVSVIVRQATPTSLSLFEPLVTELPDLTATAFQPTFTPFPADQFENPEALVTRYFSRLSDGDYQSAWQLLTRNYQETCCTALGTDPYYIFLRDWSAYQSVSLASAFLQEYDLNPAPVMVRYQVVDEDGEREERLHLYWVVVNEEGTGLLIDMVDDLSSATTP
jgi:hypothetical protein